MAKGRAKAPTKAAPRTAAPKKAPAVQRNKNKGSRKWAADNESSAELSDEESAHRPRKKKRTQVAEEGSDDDDGEDGEAEAEVEKEGGHESLSDSEVWKPQSAAIHRVNILQGWRASRSSPHIHPGGLYPQGKGEGYSTDLHWQNQRKIRDERRQGGNTKRALV